MPFEDWKWFKSQAIAESNLDPKAVSWCGARGIMQLMPATAVELGVKNPFDSEENIQGGIHYDQKMDKGFKEIDQPERRKFSLGAYNAGIGNIKKARTLSRSDYWEDLVDCLPKITGKHSEETINYVARIHEIYGIIHK